MSTKKLAKAIRDLAAKQAAPDPLTKEAADAAELLNVLARILEGKSVGRSFGAPGDWGYGTPIGDALAAQEDES